ncbi:MAG: glycoside hydrolase family 57 protein [Halarcobacter sp.]
MSKKLYLSFLWHMHQPYYKDDCTNTTLMPWVFLHAIKDYYDIPWYLEKFPNIKATFNLVPSLLTQIEGYLNGSANDKFLEMLKKDVNSLRLDEKSFLSEYLFLANEQHMVKPLPRYYELLLKYKAPDSSFEIFSNEEILELEVLFLLAWCGNFLRESNELVKALLKQEKNYSQKQKNDLINELYSFLSELIPYYKKLQDNKQIDISTTPFYHPILPLLIDRQSAKEARPDVVLPTSSAKYEDFASLQVTSAVDYFEKLFDKKPKGFWPSEGSVSNKTISLLSSHGVQWACTDEEILSKTLNNSNKELLYKPYSLKTENGKVNLFFRDKYLSDLIGFDYSKKSAKEAASDFVSHLKNIYLNASSSPLVPVILDGENAWEFYPNNAQDFFEELYKLLDEQAWCETVLFDEVPQIEDLKFTELSSLNSGSWINGNFDIWIGSPEKNKAWELLDLTKNSFDEVKNSLDEQTLQKVEKEFMIALGSDWFWWYGDDHYTELNHQFDEQFRAHLKNVFELMNKEVPREIFVPIVKKDDANQVNILQKDFISPVVDGNMSNYFEWLNCGRMDIKKEFSTMDSSSSVIEYLYYGVDRQNNLYLYLEGNKVQSLGEFELRVTLEDKIFIFDFKKKLQTISQNGTYFDLAFSKGIEIKVYDFKLKKVGFSFELFKKKKKIQRYPLYDETVLDFENLFLKSWYI